MPHIGGYVPGYEFVLVVEPTDPLVLDPGGSSSDNDQILDVNRETITETGATNGTQWKIYIVPQRSVISGTLPVVVLSSLDETKATVTQDGLVEYVDDGTFTIRGVSQATTFEPSRTKNISLTNSTNTDISVTEVWTPDTLDVSEHVLIVWNTSSSGFSENIKDYYIANRPGMATANVMSITCTTSELITLEDFETDIRDPILDWIDTNDKFIRYIILMPDIPSRTSTPNLTWIGNPSVQYLLYSALSTLGTRTGDAYNHMTSVKNNFSLGQYQGATALITSLALGTEADCEAYIDKIANAYDSNVVVSGTDAGITATGGYFIDEYQAVYGSVFETPDTAYIRDENLTISITTSAVAHLTNCSNVRGYLCWGANGGMGGNYANNGSVVFTGNSSWYLIRTVESFNGQRSVFQGNFIDWFSSNAFGGTAYSNTPVGAVTHTDEPFLGGVTSGLFWGLWEKGYTFIECAWYSRNTDRLQAIGDPLVKL